MSNQVENQSNAHLNAQLNAQLNANDNAHNDEEAITPKRDVSDVEREASTPKRDVSDVGDVEHDLLINCVNIRCNALDQRLNKYKRISIKQDKRISELHSLLLRLDGKYNTSFSDIKKSHKRDFRILNDDLSAVKSEIINYKKSNDSYTDRVVSNIYICLITIILSIFMYQAIY